MEGGAAARVSVAAAFADGRNAVKAPALARCLAAHLLRWRHSLGEAEAHNVNKPQDAQSGREREALAKHLDAGLKLGSACAVLPPHQLPLHLHF